MYGPKWPFLLMYMSHDIDVGTIVFGLSSLYKGGSARFSRVVSGYPTSTIIPLVDGLSTDPHVLRRHRN